MRIALCIEYPIGQAGGTEVLVCELIKGLASHHKFLLVSPDDETALARSPVATLIAGHIRWQLQPATASRARQLAKLMGEARLDLAHFHLGGYFGWGNRYPNRSPISHLARLGVPCITTVHLVVSVLDGFGGSRRPTWIKSLLLPLAWSGKAHQLSHVRTEIAVSRHDWEKLRRWYAPFRQHFTQIYHSRLRGGDSASAVSERELLLLNVGHIARRKGQEVLAEAFARIAGRHPGWRLQLAGHDGGDGAFQRIQKIAASQNLADRILLLGQRQDAFDLMHRASIYVQPSREEALGLALQEAMFYGCPAIGSRAGGIPELIDDQRTGLLVEAGNVSQLADALDRLIADKSRRESWGRAASASIRDKGMTVERMLERHLELYDWSARQTGGLPVNPPRL